MPEFRGLIVGSTVGANKVHMDFWNGSPGDILLRSFKVLPNRTVAVLGVLAISLALTRTTAIGTGGTAATPENATLNGVSITALDAENAGLPATITMRAAPAGGATGGAVLGYREMFMEETSPNSDTQDFVTWGDTGIIIPNGTGIRLVQGTEASVGSFNIECEFDTQVPVGMRV